MFPSTDFDEEPCILQPAKNHTYTFIERGSKLHIEVTVEVVHKDGKTTSEDVDTKVPFSFEGLRSGEEYAMKVAQTIYKEMTGSKKKQCDKNKCNA